MIKISLYKKKTNHIFLFLGVYVAIVPILMEQGDQDTITLNNVNFTAIALKFLAVMKPEKACLHHEALKL
jgi:hypothetical protein